MSKLFRPSKSLREVVIVAACRTPIGAFGGSLKGVAAPHLARTVMQETIRRAKIDPSIIGMCTLCVLPLDVHEFWSDSG